MSERNTLNILGYEVFSGEKEFFLDGFEGVVNTISPHSYIIARKDSCLSSAKH